MRIGLLTYHYTVSYGATLQTYATCKALEQLGHEVEIIDYRIEQKDSLLYRIAFYAKEWDTRKLWKRVYPPVSCHYQDAEALKTAKLDYDAIIVGSDQTWNPSISKDKCREFFLNFGPEETRRISYASSFGMSSWPAKYGELIPEIKQLLGRFHAISTREEAGQKILKDTFGIDSTLVIDPTLLIEDFSELSGNIVPNHRLISFTMIRSKQQLQHVLELGKALGKKPVMTSTIFPYRGFKYQYPSSIGKWLRDIGGADFVVVDSFHALVFCLKYHRQFVVITPDNGLNSRLKNLLDMVGLGNRFFHDIDLAIPFRRIIDEQIDYGEVDRILRQEKEKSLSFLRTSLL